jgi:NTE family protein
MSIPSFPSLPSSSNTSPTSIISAHAVFEGGGVRGIAHVGALSVAEQYGYSWDHVAGTSAGAIIASLVAAGYTASELYRIMHEIDYNRFIATPLCDPLHISNFFQLLTHNGLYDGSYIEEFVREKLVAKGIHTFGDLLAAPEYRDDPFLRYRLTIIASDITGSRMLRLPQDVTCFGLDPDMLDVALAVRMSASIPFFFEPIMLKHVDGSNSCIVDGGLLSNYPLFLFEQPDMLPDIPTFGFRLVASPDYSSAEVTTPHTPIELGKALLETMLSAHDKMYINDEKYVRTIAIPVDGIATTQFNLTEQQAQLLYSNGVHAAQKFFETWDFGAYKQTYGSGNSASHLAQLHQEMKAR